MATISRSKILLPAMDQVQMAVRYGIERSGIDGDDVLQGASGGKDYASMILFWLARQEAMQAYVTAASVNIGARKTPVWAPSGGHSRSPLLAERLST